jgi:Tol biopolymer transport system component
MRGRSLLSLAVLAALFAATSADATAPGRNGQLVFRGYLDTSRTTGALFVLNPDGSKVRRVTRPPRGVVDQEPDWSPNGRKIALERKVPCPAGGSRNGLDNFCDRVYTINRNGRGLRALVPCAFKASGSSLTDRCVGVQAPAWSPDGSRVAFRYSLVDDRYVDSFNLNSGIWIVNANGTGLRQITQETPGRSWDFSPQWSPEGTRLAFFRLDVKTQAEGVFTVGIDGRDVVQVSPSALGGANPDWSPDGQWIVFTGEAADRSVNLYKIHPDGTSLENLTRQPANGHHYLSSSFSPDGTKIATARTPGAGPERAADIVVMNADGSKIRAVTKTRRWESAVDWGPRP